MQAVATIGVYGFTVEKFLKALRTADVCRLLDVRQRRGVGKRSRSELAPAYRERYVKEILDRVDLAAGLDV